ncbi:hypothetical protein KR093_010064 [Drosophila rubida]|uniref:Uncharacterized protein n=1 Tax=Drosophila rubida TaxID=30044 RepID=A0AAD4JWM8_9MUSC|nr:hypothetical protein KR093_010064 [Drosophila rubida]
MNYLIQRGKVRQQTIGVPDGLPELLSDITREVLRCQPTKDCLCQFIIDYLHSVIVTREKAMVAQSILNRALRQVDSIISDLCVCDLTKEKSDMMSQVMEECFRNFLEKRRCEMRRGKEAIQFADVDMLEELIQKCGFSENELDKSRPTIESAYKRFVDAYMAAAVDTKGTEILYQYFRDRELKRIDLIMRNKAATTIQATWRGYAVRRTLAQHVCVCICTLDNKDEEEAKIKDKAARTIQRFFKMVLLSHITLHQLGDPCEEKETPKDLASTAAETASPSDVKSTPEEETETPPQKPTYADDEAVSGDVGPPAPPDDTPVPGAAEAPEAPPAESEAPEAPKAEDSAEPPPPAAEAEPASEQPAATEEAAAEDAAPPADGQAEEPAEQAPPAPPAP